MGNPPLSIVVRPGKVAPEVEVDVDASWPSVGDRASGGIGIVIHGDGQLVEVFGGSRQGRNAKVLEMEALLAGVRYAGVRFPGASVRVWTDCQSVLASLRSRGGASRRVYFGRVFEAADGLAAVVVEWVPRRFVAEANRLARAAALGAETPAILRVASGVAARLRDRGIGTSEVRGVSSGPNPVRPEEKETPP